MSTPDDRWADPNLPSHAKNALWRAGVTLAQSATMSDGDLLMARGFGAASLAMVRRRYPRIEDDHTSPDAH